VPHGFSDVFLFIRMEIDRDFRVATIIISRLSRPYWT
jgi:hypothetical protein